MSSILTGLNENYSRDEQDQQNAMDTRRSTDLSRERNAGLNEPDELPTTSIETRNGIYEYNVPAGQEDIAQELGLQYHKGHWVSRMPFQRADFQFGRPQFHEISSTGVSEDSLGNMLSWPLVVNKINSAMKAMGWKGQRKDDNSYMFSTKGQASDDEYYIVIIENEGEGMFRYALGTVEEGDPYIGEQATLPTTEASVSEIMNSIREGFGMNENMREKQGASKALAPQTQTSQDWQSLPRATMSSGINKTTGQGTIDYKGKAYYPSGPNGKAPADTTGIRVLVPAAAFGIRGMGDVIALLSNDGTAYAEQPIKLLQTPTKPSAYQPSAGTIRPPSGMGGLTASMGSKEDYAARDVWIANIEKQYPTARIITARSAPKAHAQLNGKIIARFPETKELDETKSLHKRVKIVKGPDSGKYGWIREIKHGAFKGAEKRYYVDIEGGGQANNLSVTDLRIAKDQQGVTEGVRDLGYDAQSLIMKLRRDVEEKRLQPTRQAVLSAARELAGDMDFAPELLVRQVLGQGVAEGTPGAEYTPKVGEEIMWRSRNPANKMMPVSGKVMSISPGQLATIKIKSPRIIQNVGKDTIVLDLNKYVLMPKQGAAVGSLTPGQNISEVSTINGRVQDPKELVWKLSSMTYDEAVTKYGADKVRHGPKLRNGSSSTEVKVPLGESKKKIEQPEADYGADYQDKVKRLGQMAKQGERKTVWDPVKRVYKTVPINPSKGVTESIVDHSALKGWDEMNASQKTKALQTAGFKAPFRPYDWSDKGEGQYTWSGWSSDELDDILHAAKVKALNQADELNMSASDRRELQRQAKQDFEAQRQQLHKEKMEMERFAWEKANTEAERKHEINKIEKEYLQDLRKLQMSHQQDMEKILHADTHELNKMKAEFNMRQAERAQDNPQQNPQTEPDDLENNFDQDTGEPLKPNATKPPQSNQWHTSQQVGYTPTKPTKPTKTNKDDDVTDVEPKPNKLLALGNSVKENSSSILTGINELNENLNQWFKEKWVRFGPDGKIRGDCARGDDSEGKPKCLPQSKAQSLGKKGRASAAARKRREDPNPERSGKAINVATKKKSNEGVAEGLVGDVVVHNYTKIPIDLEPGQAQIAGWGPNDEPLYRVKGQDGKEVKTWSKRRMLTIAKEQGVAEEQLDEKCWKGYHKEGNKKMFGKTYPNCVKNTNEEQEQIDEKCWDTHKQVGMKNKGGKQVPNCVPKESIEESRESCPECGGPMFSDMLLAEKQDACYNKVKSRYKVWPSAYASGALVQCRKKGAANWGNGGKKNESVEENQLDEKWSNKYKDSINCSDPKGFSQKAHCAGKKKSESAIMKGLVDETLGTPYPGTYEQEMEPFKRKGQQQRVQKIAFEGKK